MRTTIAMAVLLLFAVNVSGNEVIRVVPLQRDAAPVFKCGDRCKFRGEIPNEPVRLRIFRGTVAQLTALGNHPGNVAAGCIEFYSTIIRPRRSRRATAVLDLNFYFRTTWLSNGRNGHYVFVVERDDRPNGPEIETSSMLRLPAAFTGTYFGAGRDVTVLAPVNRSAPKTAKKAKARNGHSPAEPRMAMMVMDDAPIPIAVAAPVRPADRDDCVHVQLDPRAVLFRSAEADPTGDTAPGR